MSARLWIKLTCDKCGQGFEFETHRPSAARDEARRRWGWKHVANRDGGGERDLCPNCKPRVIT
jgi:hypothetical protein